MVGFGIFLLVVMAISAIILIWGNYEGAADPEKLEKAKQWTDVFESTKDSLPFFGFLLFLGYLLKLLGSAFKGDTGALLVLMGIILMIMGGLYALGITAGWWPNF